VTTTGHIQKVSQKTNADFPERAAHDHTWTPVYDGEKITEIHDNDGQTAHYVYDPDEYLSAVEADGHHIHYDYDNLHRITGVVEDGHAVQIHCDAEGRADRVGLPNGSMNIHYSGASIEVEAAGQKYSVTIMPSYFRVVESLAMPSAK
jgi:YD repeat-containing protein